MSHLYYLPLYRAYNRLILRCVGQYCSSSSHPDNITFTTLIPHIQKHNFNTCTENNNHTHPPHVVKVSFPKSCSSKISSSSILIYLFLSYVMDLFLVCWGPYASSPHALYKGQSYLRSMPQIVGILSKYE